MRTPGAFILLVVAGSAFGQAYECRTPSGNIVRQYGVPCAPGMDTKDPALEAARRKEQERETKDAQKKRDVEAAVLRREVQVGMTLEQVLRAWGHPARHTVEESASGTRNWYYWRCVDPTRGSNAVVFRDGIVSSIYKACS